MTACCSSTDPHDTDPDDGNEHWVKPPPVVEHPAKFTPAILDKIKDLVNAERHERGAVRVLDPFAGTGLIHQLADVGGIDTYGIELQPEWARMHPRTLTGSVLDAPRLFFGARFTVLATSYCYGNRMGDCHDAKDPCKVCGGSGRAEAVVGHRATCDRAHDDGDLCNEDGAPPCTTCKGSGLSKRNTYTHYLVRQGIEPVVTDDNAARMQWGPKYRAFHSAAWKACREVLEPGALVILNGKNHYRGDQLQRVVEFHLNDWLVAGAVVEQVRKVPVSGNGQGANGTKRVPYETVAALRWKP